jgi:hypothetical protein
MDDTAARDFFLKPSCAQQRQYEALRAVFVEGLSQKAAALRFGYSPGAFRQLVLGFRSARAAGKPPPFSPNRARGDHRGAPEQTSPPSPISPPRPTPGP